jgi:formate C-acetyltransferase
LSIWEQGALKSDPLVIRKANALRLLLEETPAIILEDELIVGLRTIYSPLGEGENVFGSTYMLPVKPATKHKKPFYPRYLTESERSLAFKAGISEGAFTSHVPFGTSKVLKYGIKGIKKQAETRLKKIRNENPNHVNFLKAVIESLDAVSDFIKKHHEMALNIAQTTNDESRRKELIEIADNCEWISTEPPRSFYDAIQLFWFCTIVMALESQSCIPIGRLDQDLWPFLEKDLQTKTITRENARELVQCLWIKLNFESDLTTDTCRNITIGGTFADGMDATNELTYMFLEASNKLRLADPKLNVRLHKGTPKLLWKKTVELVQAGLGGFPAFYNDEAIIEGLMKMGLPLEEARLYSCDGCQEIIIPGKGDFYPVHTGVNLLECVQLTLGIEPMIINVGAPTLTIPEPKEHKTFEEFMEDYYEKLNKLVCIAVEEGNIRDTALALYSPVPFLSSTLEGCIENAKDKTMGGCIYNWTGCNGQAFASAVNSLAAVKRMVFDEKLMTLSELRHQLKEDWPNERLRQYAMNRVPKWGNDNDYVDSIAVKVAKRFIDEVIKYENPRGGPYYPGIFTFHHVSRGIRTSASPDGRHAGDSISAHISPQAGTDKMGPTHTVNSALKITELRPPEGTVLDLRFHPSALMGDQGLNKLESFIRTFIEQGGTVIQFNVVDSVTLRKAQVNPEQYRALLVRVWGFSAYFTTLTTEYQNEIIERTEHGIN